MGHNFIGFDFGASNGRAILGIMEDGKLTVSELHRFPNDPVELNGTLVWDVPRLFFEMKVSLTEAAKRGIRIDSIGIDTWGVDYGLLDKQGRLVSLPVHYRDKRTDGIMERCFEKVMAKKDIFRATGLAFNQFNTLYQLYAMREQNDPALDVADKLLFMPDLLAYFLTGKMGTEYTVASTSQLIDPATRDWSDEILNAFGISRSLFAPIEQPGTVRGTLLPSIAAECGVPCVPVIAVASHDTASAVASVPAKDADFAYISSGTWSLLGAETLAPIVTEAAMDSNYTNEGGVFGTTRFLKNIMGLWIIQECKREWDRRMDSVDYAQLVEMAEKAPAFKAVIDVDDETFYAPGDMPNKIQAFCRKTGQAVPEGRGEISRVVYESLALKYRWAVEKLEQDALGRRIRNLNIVGGGSKNVMLNRFTAQCLGVPVIAGPGEGTVIGNLMLQAFSAGDVKDLAGIREAVAASFPTDVYEPDGDRAAWDKAYAKLLEIMK